MKELRKLINGILNEIYVLGYYPMIVYNNINGDNTKNIRFYLDENDRVKCEMFTDADGVIRKSLLQEEINYCISNKDKFVKYKRVGC